MRVSLNMIRQLVDFDLPPKDELIEKIGAQLGGVEAVYDYGQKYKGVIIVKVISCVNHPNSDHLHLCMIDDGGVVKDVERNADGHVQVVCGASNVRANMSAVWLSPGTIVPQTTDNDPYKLEVRDIRGLKSNGMLASARELGLGDDHNGIVDILDQVDAGEDFATKYGLDDIVIDIENKMFTHRPDLFGQLGIAREVAGICGRQFKSPSWYATKWDITETFNSELNFSVHNELNQLVPRFTAIGITGVKVTGSPLWLISALVRLGQKPVNNVVDITNYYMLLTAQPLHAYDYDKIKLQNEGSVNLIVRKASPKEQLKLINNKIVTLSDKDIVIATDKHPIGLAGIMGGAECEVSQSTTNIILECATFDMYSIRRSCMELGIFTEAATRFTKGQSTQQNLAVLGAVCGDIETICSGKISSNLVDDKHETESSSVELKTSADFLSARLGMNIKSDEVSKLLSNVEFECNNNGNFIDIRVPFWRTDISIQEDILEEVGRLKGYDNLPLLLPSRVLTPVSKNYLLKAKSLIRSRLSAAGANEVLTYSFVHGKLIDGVGQNKELAYQLANALSPDLQFYRMSIIPSLLDKVHAAIKNGTERFAMFEIGMTHTKERGLDNENLPVEDQYVGLVFAANDHILFEGAPYYMALKYLNVLTGGEELSFKPISIEDQKYAVMCPYLQGRSALVSVKETGQFLGILGEFKQSVTSKLKLPKYCSGFELDTTVLADVIMKESSYVPLSKFPSVEQDISLKAPVDICYSVLYDFVHQVIADEAPKNTTFKLTPVDIYQSPKDTNYQHITLRLSISSYIKTMTASEVNALLDQVSLRAKESLKAERL